MPKIGRNDPCPCGSGKKYKKCCQNQSLNEIPQSNTGYIFDEDSLDQESNQIVDLIHQGRFDEAEKAAFKLLIDYPDVHDGFERLGMLYEKQGKNAQAAEMYQKALDFIIDKDGFDEEGRDYYREKISLLRK